MTQRNDCPECGNRTFHQTPTGRQCSRCGIIDDDINIPQNKKSTQCRNCGRKMVFENQGVRSCRNCGAQYS
jgi:hypothetical protein